MSNRIQNITIKAIKLEDVNRKIIAFSHGYLFGENFN